MKKLKWLLMFSIFTLLCMLINSKVHATMIYPALPINDDFPHVISVYDMGINSTRRVYLTYCKNTDYKLVFKNYSEIGRCYDSNGNSQGYAYRRSINYNGSTITQDDIINGNVDWGNYTWGSEYYGNEYGTALNWDNNLNRFTMYSDYQDNAIPTYGQLITLLTGNTSIYKDDLTTFAFDEALFVVPTPDPTPVCTKTKVLGAVSNVDDFTLSVSGVSNALSEHLSGYFTFSHNGSYIASNDWDVSFSSNETLISGDYDLTCPANETYCNLYFDYNYDDDIDTQLDLNFTISTISGVNMPSFIKLTSCSTNDDYVNLTYTYSFNTSSSSFDSNMFNFLNDGSLPDISGLSDTSLIPSGPVDAILTLPLNVMSSLLNVLNSHTCQPLVLPIPFTNDNLTLPCISTIYSRINGLSSFLSWFSSIISAFILYQYFIYLYKWVDDTLTFRENNHFGGY